MGRVAVVARRGMDRARSEDMVAVGLRYMRLAQSPLGQQARLRLQVMMEAPALEEVVVA